MRQELHTGTVNLEDVRAVGATNPADAYFAKIYAVAADFGDATKSKDQASVTQALSLTPRGLDTRERSRPAGTRIDQVALDKLGLALLP